MLRGPLTGAFSYAFGAVGQLPDEDSLWFCGVLFHTAWYRVSFHGSSSALRAHLLHHFEDWTFASVEDLQRSRQPSRAAIDFDVPSDGSSDVFDLSLPGSQGATQRGGCTEGWGWGLPQGRGCVGLVSASCSP